MFIRKVNEADGEALQRIAIEILTPLYGDQAKALNEWLTGVGFKHAFVSVKDGQVTGLLSLKANPAKSYLKISTLLVLQEYQKSGCGRAMMTHAERFAHQYKFCSIVVTVSETKPESIRFFQKNGFNIINEAEGKYQEGVTEFIMKRKII